MAKKKLASKSSGKKSKPRTAKPRIAVPRAAKAQSACDFATVFAGLKQVLGAFEPQLRVSVDEPRKYYLVTKANSWKGGPMFFGAVMILKGYVSYHLLPLYACPELVKTVSPELKKRMQGKACFNFRAPDASLFAELKELTQAGIQKYRAKNWL
jgi:hypothetical protein